MGVVISGTITHVLWYIRLFFTVLSAVIQGTIRHKIDSSHSSDRSLSLQ